jgi:UDP-glucose 4-epimerase
MVDVDARTLASKSVLVTGATGFIGRHLVRRLRELGTTRLFLLSRRAAADDRDGAWIQCPLEDLSRETWVAAGIDEIDIVFHLGGFAPKTSAEANERDQIVRSNIIGTWRLVSSLPSPPGSFVFASSIDVYGAPPEGAVLTETSSTSPATLHGASKLFGERLAATCETRVGSGPAILRYSHTVGPGEDAYAKLIPEAIRSLLRGKAPVINGDGSAERDFIAVDDIVEATIRAGLRPQAVGAPINVATGRSRSIRSIVETLASIIGFDGPLSFRLDRPPGHSIRVATDRMRAALGMWEFVPIEQVLRDEVEQMKDLL